MSKEQLVPEAEAGASLEKKRSSRSDSEEDLDGARDKRSSHKKKKKVQTIVPEDFLFLLTCI
jgi:hypothetical protein